MNTLDERKCSHILVNRLEMPVKHVLICEDDLDFACDAIRTIRRLYGHQGKVGVSVVPGAEQAVAIIGDLKHKVDLILLDHDMPWGNGSDLIDWLKDHNTVIDPIPTITCSGIESNNLYMTALGATHRGSKNELKLGELDHLIQEILEVE